MGLLKRIHDNAKAGAERPINPCITDGGAQFYTKWMNKVIAKALDKETEDYVNEGRKQGYAEATYEYEKKHKDY